MKKLSKINFISNGDDYQILFTASKNKSRIIKKFSNYRIKITKLDQFKIFIKNLQLLMIKTRNYP